MKCRLFMTFFVGLTGLLVVYSLPSQAQDEVPVDSSSYNKLTDEQVAALTQELRETNLIGAGDSLTPVAGFTPSKVDKSKIQKGSKAEACAADCEKNAAKAKKVCIFAVFFGQKDTCELIVKGVSAVCVGACMVN